MSTTSVPDVNYEDEINSTTVKGSMMLSLVQNLKSGKLVLAPESQNINSVDITTGSVPGVEYRQ